MLSLETVYGASKFVQVGLARDAEPDSPALRYHQTCTRSGATPPRRKVLRRPTRKRRKLAKSFKPDVSLQATTFDRNIKMLPYACDQDGREGPSLLAVRSTQTVADASEQDGSIQTTSDRCEQSMTDFPGQVGSVIQAVSLCGPSSSSNSKTSNREGVTKEDFMALLCLTPSHVAARFRKCTRHRASKYLYIKSRNLWNKICREHHYNQDVETAKRPSYVLLERNSVIDSLALQLVPGFIHLQSLNKCDNYRKRMSKRKTLSLNVDLVRDPGLEQLALQAYKLSSSHGTPGTNVSRVPMLASLMSLPTDSNIRQALENPGCKRLCVEINRHSGLDMLAIQASDSNRDSISSNCPGVNSLEKLGFRNLSIKIIRDSNIDQLALQNSNSSVSYTCSDCYNTNFPNDQPASVPTSTSISTFTAGCREGLENAFKRVCRTKLRLLPNVKAQNDTNISEARSAVIKLRRMAGGWSVIRPNVDRNRNDLIQLQSPNGCKSGLEPSCSKSNSSESADSESTTTVKLTRNPRICISPLPTSSASGSEDEVRHETRPPDSQSVVNDPCQLNLPRQQNPVFRSSVRKTFDEMVPCSKFTRRAKSVPIEEPRKHHNENKNPRKPVIPPIKTIRKVTVAKARGSRKHCVLQNGSLKETHSISENDRSRDDICSIQPTISRRMHI